MGSLVLPKGVNARGGTSRSVPLLAGDAGTAQTIDLIRRAVHAGLSNPTVRATAGEILRNVPAYNDRAAAEAIFNWVRQKIRFTNDPVGHETISSPDWTINHGIGDCDDINAVLLPTLLMVVGYPVRLVTLSNDPSDPSRFSHIYAEVEINGQWIPLDAARPGATFGTTVNRYLRKRVWSLVDKKFQDLAGLAGVKTGSRTGMGFNWNVFADVLKQGTTAISDVLKTIPPRIVVPGSTGPGSPAPVSTFPTGLALAAGGLGLLFVMSQKR